jgi:arginine decarboxylase
MAKNGLIAREYFNIGQLRLDLWNRLQHCCTHLERTREGSETDKELHEEFQAVITDLKGIERYYAFPGIERLLEIEQGINHGEYQATARHVVDTVRLLISDAFRSHPDLMQEGRRVDNDLEQDELDLGDQVRKNYFEVLVVEDLSAKEEKALKDKIRFLNESEKDLRYEVVVQPSFQDALITLLFNFNIQAVVIRYAPPYRSRHINGAIKPFIHELLSKDYSGREEEALGPLLGKLVKDFRPELDIYYVTDTSLSHLKESTLKYFRRIFYRVEDVQEMHLAIIRGIKTRLETPFFTALKEYSAKPVGVFHAMPISRGNSVFKSRWIKDFGEFYGRNMFLAETSSTSGGLDSLLQPTGPIKKAQEKASEAYGSQRTYFVTNGTSTANKIVLQALVEPGDLVLVDRDCHKSHHYGLMLAGAFPVYLDSYPVPEYSMYGAVPLKEIKEKLLRLKKAGRLDRVKMLLLTNCTFDGLVYNVERFMEEVLAIKPDMIFLWDEAWFAFAGFSYNYKLRTGMYAAANLKAKYSTESYKRKYREHIKSLKRGQSPLLPDPKEVRIRVYSTQSTHKTLSSFRQGSMIHIWDEDFRRYSSDSFQEAYMTHTSTSPNYQILASLDVGRRQVMFEGYEMVEKSLELAMILRARINDHPRLRKYFKVLTVGDLIPAEHRTSGLEEYYTEEQSWNRMEDAWKKDEFVLDPTKITISVGKAGIDGDTFKNKFLMDKFNLQINKTSRNTVLFMTNIGTTRGSVAYLMNAMLKIADELEAEQMSLNKKELEIHQQKVHSLMVEVPPLPDFSYFHSSFQAVPGVPGGDIRKAYFKSYKEDECEFIPLAQCLEVIDSGRELVSTSFIIPYPPGFPVLVPGQVVSKDILTFLLKLDVKEIHGYRAELGLKVFKEESLTRKSKKQ